MILDKLENRARYRGISREIDLILEAAAKKTAADFPSSREYLDGTDAFLNYAQYETQDISQAKFEFHRNYIDVMCMIEGEEYIYQKPTENLSEITVAYQEENDCALAKFDSDHSTVLLQKGYFCILFPEDAHAPAQAVHGPAQVKKLIGKARVK